MFIQLFIGSSLLLFSLLFSALGFWIIEARLYQLRFWLRRARMSMRMLVFLSMASVWILVQLTVAVWMWAACFWSLGIFETWEPAVYFALVSFTTLGFGDILLPQDWRLLGGITAMNGLLNVGVVTAILVEFLRQARLAPEDN